MDLIVPIPNDAEIWINDGNGTFTKRVPSGLDAATNKAICVGDIDSDGDIDFFSGNRVGANKLYRNNGLGTLSLMSDVSLDSNALSCAMGDINGDGALDIVVVSDTSSTTLMQIWMQTGATPAFTSVTAPLNTQGSTYYEFLAFGDADGDGDADLVITTSGGGGPGFSGGSELYINDGSGEFTIHPNSPVNVRIEEISGARAIAWGDIDGDADSDLVISYYERTSVTGDPIVDVFYLKVWINSGANAIFVDGTATALPGSIGVTSEKVFQIALGDTDGDGDLDLIADRYLFINNGGGVFSAPSTHTSTTCSASPKNCPLQLADVDGDGALEIYYGSSGESDFRAFGDTNGDGRLDMIVGNSYYVSSGTTLPQDTDPCGTSMDCFSIVRLTYIFDLDGDGLLDVLAFHGSYDAQRVVYLNKGGAQIGKFSQHLTYGAMTTLAISQPATAFADVDNDGDMDFITIGMNVRELWMMTTCSTGARLSTGGCGNCGAFSRRATLSDICVECPSHSARGGGGTCDPCSPGQQRDDGEFSCSGCPLGYATMGSLAPCAACEPGSIAATTGSLICSVCAGGSYTGDNASTACITSPIGAYSSIGATAPQPCPAGRYGDAAGRPDLGCSGACAPGYYCPESSTNSTAIQCPPGRYSLGSARSIEDCTLCPAGKSLPHATIGTSSASCVDCAGGSYSASPGLAADVCTHCPHGSYTAGTGATSCTVCPVGKHLPIHTVGTSAASCVSCLPGSFNNELGLAADACFPCANGSVSEEVGSTSCTQCPQGTHLPTSATSCVSCLPGSFNNELGLAADLCAPCPSGSFSEGVGSTSCTQCPQGTHLPTSATSCVSCLPGSFNNELGLAADLCAPCPSGSFSEGVGSTSCELCPQGTHLPTSVVGVSIASCAACAPGSYGSTLGLATDACTLCPAGKFSEELSSISCSECPAGAYCPEGAVEARACREQIPYSTTINAGITSIDGCFCAVGYYLGGNGTSRECVQCDSIMDCSIVGNTLAELPILPGGWRFSPESTVIWTCHNEAACDNTLVVQATATNSTRRRLQSTPTFGDALCAEGHRGFLCGTCIENWHGYSDSQVCSECGGSLALAFMPLVLIILALVGATIAFIRTGEMVLDAGTLIDGGTQSALKAKAEELFQNQVEAVAEENAEEKPHKGCKENTRWFMFTLVGKVQNFTTKLKILLSLWQVLQGISAVFSIPFPTFYEATVDEIGGLIQIELPAIMPIDCIVSMNYYSKLIFKTTWPLVAYAGLFLSSKALRRTGQNAKADSLIDFLFLIMFILYPSISSKLLSMIYCIPLEDGTSWLRVDLSIQCTADGIYTPEHFGMLLFTFIMIGLHTVGTPAIYAYLFFWKHHAALEALREQELSEYYQAKLESPTVFTKQKSVAVAAVDENDPDQRKRAKIIPADVLPGYMIKLTGGYEYRTYWFELFETIRKVLLVGIPSTFPQRGGTAQLFWGLLVCFSTFGAYMMYAPFVEDSDDTLSQMAQVQIFLTLLSSLALRAHPPDKMVGDLVTVVLFIVPLMAIVLETPAVEYARQGWANAKKFLLIVFKRILPKTEKFAIMPLPDSIKNLSKMAVRPTSFHDKSMDALPQVENAEDNVETFAAEVETPRR